MNKKVLVEVSARHVHVAKEDFAILFGENYQLTAKKNLSQPGQFACEERVNIVGPKGEIKNISILGPERGASQVEVSLTDARVLGIDAMIRESGDIEGTNGCKLVGPVGEVVLGQGVIAAKRHIHMNEEEAIAWGLKDKDVIGIKVDNEYRSLIFNDVVVRVSSKFAAAVHIDTDEANAAGFRSGEGEIVFNQ